MKNKCLKCGERIPECTCITMNIEEAKEQLISLRENAKANIDTDEIFRLDYEAIETVLNELEKKDKTITSKDKEIKILKDFHNQHVKIINEMAKRLSYVEDLKLDVCVYCKQDCRIPRNEGDFIKTECIKEYFYKKVEGKEYGI